MTEFEYQEARSVSIDFRRAHRELGAKGVVNLPIVNGQRKVRTGGKVRFAERPNLPKRAQVIVKSIQGTRIVIEEADALPASVAI